MTTEAATSMAISVSNLHKTYRDRWLFGKKFQALKGLSLEVGNGQIFGLLGPNGAGKTTFLKILLGIIGKTSGQASLLGHPAGSLKGRRLVGYLPEQLQIPRHLTAYTALNYYGNLSNVPSNTIRQKQDELLEFVGLGGRGRDRVTKYSKGMRQRLGLAQALLHDPQLLVMDEPTDGLDPGARAEMRTLMQQLRDKGVTIFLNSHLLQEVEMVCDRVAILNRGNLRYCGPVKDVGEFVRGGSADGRQHILLELGADRESTIQLAEAAEGLEISSCESTQSRTILTAYFEQQEAVDRFVDTVRRKGISLMALTPQITSLEDAFLSIVSNDQQSAKK